MLAVAFPALLFLTSCGLFTGSPIVITFGAGGASVGSIITFTATVTPTQGATYFWEFGDGATGSGNPATHVYSAARTYLITLHVFIPGPPLGSVSAQESELIYTKTLVIGGGSSSVTPYIYWTNRADNTIGRANLDGSGVNNSFISTGFSPIGIAVDANYIYWTNGGADSIGRANLDGTGVNNSFITGIDCCALGIAVDANYIYWVWDDEYVARANLDGTGVNQTFVDSAASGFTSGVAVNGTHIFWSDTSNDTIGRANLDGTGVNGSFVNLLSMPELIAVDDTHIYFTRPGADLIGRSTIDGAITDHTLIVTGDSPRGVAVSGDYVYWTNGNDNTIGRRKKDGSVFDAIFITTGNFPRGIAIGP